MIRMLRSRAVLAAALGAALCAGTIYAALQTSTTSEASLAAVVPSGALLAIESPDFATLLKSWGGSQEQTTWLKGADYEAFSRSRLFERLAVAQSKFTVTAGLPPDTRFLQQIAGGDSVFAWYDIGNLEFLYITRMPSGEAAKTPLLALKEKFEERKVGDTSFYVRTKKVTTDYTQSAAQSQAGSTAMQWQSTESESGAESTVAFAVRGDYLLLATREDLIADALQLMQQPGSRTLENDSWYSSTVAAANRPRGDLRMTLDLSKIVKSAYFRSYWIQQNISEMKQYTAALSDLYRSAGSFREERVLLAANAKDSADTDLGPLLDFVPAQTGVYRAEARPTSDSVLAKLQDKLLVRRPAAYRDPHIAPTADLSTPTAGDASNLEQRIDEPAVVIPSQVAVFSQLHSALDTASLTASLTFSTAAQSQRSDVGVETVFLPVRTAVVLAAANPWNSVTLQQGLTAALAPQLSVNAAGLSWTPRHDAQTTWLTLSGEHPLAMSVQGKLCVIASDEAMLLQLLAASRSAGHKPNAAGTIAGFDHRSERAPFVRLTELFDRDGGAARNSADRNQSNDSGPGFFSGNMVSLSDTFQSFDAETFTESVAPNHVTHQTVVYTLHPAK